MRSRIAGVGVIVAVAVGLAGAAAVAVAITASPEAIAAAAAPSVSGAPVATEQEEPQPDDAAATDAAATPAAATPAASASQFPTIEDYCYIEGMGAHHEQALELSRLVLDADGVRERTRALAEFIAVDQSTEIETMHAWRDAWIRAIPSGGTAASAHTEHGGSVDGIPTGCGSHADHTVMKGMASPDQLAALAASDGAAADRLFLELMIVHHEGALEMATTAVTEGSNAFVRSSAKHVLVEQEREITAMTGLLAEAG